MLKFLMYTKLLAIETSCDETAAAVFVDGKLRSNVVYSQIDLHKQYGGVVPSIAKLAHEQKLPGIIDQALSEAGIGKNELEAVAVTIGPGLAIALEIGISTAKSLATELNIPVLPINHMEGHLWSWSGDAAGNESVAEQASQVSFPVLGLLVSGGHTEWVNVSGVGEYAKIGQTLDDACGEAFDKVATMLGLGYPGGPVVSKLANEIRGNYSIIEYRENASMYLESKFVETKYRLPIPLAGTGELNVSFSGLKTAVKQLIAEMSGASQKLNIQETGANANLTEEQVKFICLLFETTAFAMIERKVRLALKHSPARELWLGGGVVANTYFRAAMQRVAADFDLVLRYPQEKILCADNAGMIGIVATLRSDLATTELTNLDRNPSLSFRNSSFD